MVAIKSTESPKPVATAICYDCKYFRGAKLGTCQAFPERIPDRIWSGDVRHDKSFPGIRESGFTQGIRVNS
jgi:hypothetical protein